MKILVVDDNPAIADFITTILRDDGHDVATVGSGSQAITASLMADYDLLICDLMLPDLQGTEIVRALKAQSPRLPVIVTSSLEPCEYEQPCLDAGAARYLQKPLRAEDLHAEVALVDKARLQLKIALIDSDHFHRTRVSKVLQALGCEVHTFADAALAQSDVESRGAVLLVVDADVPGATELIQWAKHRGNPVFAFQGSPDAAREEALMRAGAAFLLGKPVDIDALLTQASFLGAL